MQSKIEDLKTVIRQFSFVSQDLLSENENLQEQLNRSKEQIDEYEQRIENIQKEHQQKVDELNRRLKSVKQENSEINDRNKIL